MVAIISKAFFEICD